MENTSRRVCTYESFSYPLSSSKMNDTGTDALMNRCKEYAESRLKESKYLTTLEQKIECRDLMATICFLGKDLDLNGWRCLQYCRSMGKDYSPVNFQIYHPEILAQWSWCKDWFQRCIVIKKINNKIGTTMDVKNMIQEYIFRKEGLSINIYHGLVVAAAIFCRCNQKDIFSQKITGPDIKLCISNKSPMVLYHTINNMELGN